MEQNNLSFRCDEYCCDDTKKANDLNNNNYNNSSSRSTTTRSSTSSWYEIILVLILLLVTNRYSFNSNNGFKVLVERRLWNGNNNTAIATTICQYLFVPEQNTTIEKESKSNGTSTVSKRTKQHEQEFSNIITVVPIYNTTLRVSHNNNNRTKYNTESTPYPSYLDNDNNNDDVYSGLIFPNIVQPYSDDIKKGSADSMIMMTMDKIRIGNIPIKDIIQTIVIETIAVAICQITIVGILPTLVTGTTSTRLLVRLVASSSSSSSSSLRSSRVVNHIFKFMKMPSLSSSILSKHSRLIQRSIQHFGQVWKSFVSFYSKTNASKIVSRGKKLIKMILHWNDDDHHDHNDHHHSYTKEGSSPLKG